MRAYLDTDALVALTARRHPRHKDVAQAVTEHGVGFGDLRVSLHSTAEAYATLTKTVLPYGGSPGEVAETIAGYYELLDPVALDGSHYRRALDICVRLSIPRAGIYDALHVAAGEASGCEALFSLNVKHFTRMESLTEVAFIYPGRASN